MHELNLCAQLDTFAGTYTDGAKLKTLGAAVVIEGGGVGVGGVDGGGGEGGVGEVVVGAGLGLRVSPAIEGAGEIGWLVGEAVGAEEGDAVGFGVNGNSEGKTVGAVLGALDGSVLTFL